MCICICNRAAVSPCRQCAGVVTSKGKPGQPYGTLPSTESPAEVRWGRTSPTVPEHPPCAVPGWVPGTSVAPYMSPRSAEGKVLLAERFLADIGIFAMVMVMPLVGHLSSRYPKELWELPVSHWATHCFGVTLESSRHFELFEDTRVLLVVSSGENLRLTAVGVIFSSEFGVDVSTLPCHQQPPVPPSSVVQWLVMLLVLVVETWGVHLLLAKAASCCLLTALSGYSCFLPLFQFSLLKDRAKNSQEMTYIKNRCMWKQPSRWYNLAHKIWEAIELRWYRPP